MTNKDIEELNKQKEQLKLINEEYLKTNNNELNIKEREIDKYMKDSELFIEVCDYRDIKRSRNREIEKEIIDKGKKLLIWLNYCNEMEIDKSSIENDDINIFEDMNELNGIKKICIIGYPKSGKFYLKKLIEDVRKEIDCSIMSMEVNEPISISEVLRGAIDEEKIDMVYFANKLFEYIDIEKLSEYYRIPCVTNTNKLLETLGEKLIGEGKGKIKKGAIQLIKDLKTNKIRWMANNNGFIIKFK